MSLTPPETVRKLQEALHTKAKESPSYRFYALFDKVYRKDVLHHAYERCRANRGAAGVDGGGFRGHRSEGRVDPMAGRTGGRPEEADVSPSSRCVGLTACPRKAVGMAPIDRSGSV